MPENPEAIKLRKKLEDEVDKFIDGMRVLYDKEGVAEMPPGLVSDWVLVVAVDVMGSREQEEEGGRPNSEYHLAFKDGWIDDHRAVGLLRMAEHLMLFGERAN